jgi:hypothetical protein
MNQNITNAAYLTLQTLGLAPEGAEFNDGRNLWYFNATDNEFLALCVALRSDAARSIGDKMQAAAVDKTNARQTARRTSRKAAR